MKKLLFLASVVFIFASIAYAATFTCYRYVNGEPTGTWISVTASSKSEAERIAYARMKEIGGRLDCAVCRY